jgi:hypothetical protein
MDTDLGHQQQQEEQQQMEATPTPKVYAAIAKVTAALATQGIAKGRTNQQQNYSFRGIDDVYNALARHLSNAGLCVLPRVLSRECVERVSAKGGALFYVTVKVEYSFVCAEDGSAHVVTTYGEAMDSGDKATNKAMSAAYKYAAMQAFCIPTEGDNDADATTHEVATGIGQKAEADLMASLDEVQNLEDLRSRTKIALAVAQQGADAEAHKRIKAKSIALAAKFKEEAAMQ